MADDDGESDASEAIANIEGVTDGEVVGSVRSDIGDIPVALSADLVEQAEQEGIPAERLRAAALPDDDAVIQINAQSDRGDSTVIPVMDHIQTDLTSRRRLTADRDFQFIQDDQIQRLIKNSVNYTERVGRWMLTQDDLIPAIKERLKALITGEDGLEVEPADPEASNDNRLADHLRERYRDDVRPTEVIDVILRENLMNARSVHRATDLNELDLSTLDFLKDGVTGEEVYVQDRTTVYEIQDDEDDPDGVSLEQRTFDPRKLIIGEQVFDISLYDTPPLEAVANTTVNKMVLQRLKARKAEITSFGAVYAKVEPPAYLEEDQYHKRVKDDDWDGDGQPPTKLERALNNDIQNAFDTLKDFQSGTVMSIPENWSMEQLEIPETNDPIDDQIRGYNRDISRRLLVPLDLIELQSGSELSRETMFATLMTTIAGWRREIIRVFDQFADVQAEIHGLGEAEVDHTFPPLRDADTQNIISALQFAGIAGMSETEVRQLINTIQGADLETDRENRPDEPPAGGPTDPSQRQQDMEDFLQEQRRGPAPNGQEGDAIEAALSDDGRSVKATEDGDPVCWVCGIEANLVNETPPYEYTCDYHGISPNHVPIGEADINAQEAGQEPGQGDAAGQVAQTLEASTHTVTRRSAGADGDLDVALDWPMHVRPPEPSRVDVKTVQTVTGGRLSLPPVPQKNTSQEGLRGRINDMVEAILDTPADSLPFDARVAERPPDFQPFVDITESVPVDVLERVVSDLPRRYMTTFESITAERAEAAHVPDDAIRFGNLGGLPFDDQEMLDVFIGALFDVGADQVWLGDQPWDPEDRPEDSDRPIFVDGLTMEQAETVWQVFEDEAGALTGPRKVEASSGDNGADQPGDPDGRPNVPGIYRYDLFAEAAFSEGEEVETPAGIGVVVEVRTENFEGPEGDVEAGEDDPAYIVGVEDGVRVYREDDLSDGDIEVDVDSPEEELAEDEDGEAARIEAIFDGVDESDVDALEAAILEAQFGDFNYPPSWRKSEQPARLILLKAWAGMNGQFDCPSGDCCKGTMLRSGLSNRAANQFCASMKDEVLGGWTGWRSGG